ncbi:HAD family hydrolase [soil metagenome]
MADGILLISDVDDTMLGDDAALERFVSFHGSVGIPVTIVYASGRFFESLSHDVRTTPLPVPAVVIGGVGSEIRTYPGGEPDGIWIERISQNWSAARVRSVLEGEPGMQMQPEADQSDYKVSAYLHDATQEQLDHLKARLEEAALETSLIYSSARDLDVLPGGVDKGTAAAFVAGRLGFGRDRVLVAGNSGNDAKLFQHGFYGIVVGNADDDLKVLAAGPRDYHSPKSHADGVRDGIEHWIAELTPNRG